MKIAILPGDGIGPEIMAQAKRVLDTVNQLRSSINGVHISTQNALIGGCAIDQTGKLS